eukprot:4466193-Prymnesium_polylepis.1
MCSALNARAKGESASWPCVRGGAHVHVAHRAHRLDVRTGGEGLIARSCQHNRTDRRVGVECRRALCHLCHERRAQSVESLRPVQEDDTDGTARLRLHARVVGRVAHTRGHLTRRRKPAKSREHDDITTVEDEPNWTTRRGPARVLVGAARVAADP